MSETYYQSGYTGLQIDHALGRIVNGELDKLAAGATNAAAAAQSALSGVQTAIKNIPSGSTPIVNDLTTGGVEMALSAEQGKLLGQRPNPNMLDNWYFVDPINQRGETEYIGAGYGIDRWRTNFSGDTVSVTANGVKNVIASSSVGWHLHQIIAEGAADLVGRKITASFLMEAATNSLLRPIVSFRNSDDSEISFIRANAATGLVTFSGTVPDGTANIRIGFYANPGVASGDYVTVKAVKLELGSVQTLAHQDADGNWVLNDPPPNKQQELAKCQRYQYVADGYLSVSGVLSNSKTDLFIMVPTPVSMRAKPTVSQLEMSGVRTTVGSNVTPEIISYSCSTYTPHGVNLTVTTATFTGDSYTNNTPIWGYVRKLVLDANL